MGHKHCGHYCMLCKMFCYCKVRKWRGMYSAAVLTEVRTAGQVEHKHVWHRSRLRSFKGPNLEFMGFKRVIFGTYFKNSSSRMYPHLKRASISRLSWKEELSLTWRFDRANCTCSILNEKHQNVIPSTIGMEKIDTENLKIRWVQFVHFSEPILQVHLCGLCKVSIRWEGGEETQLS